MNYTIKIALRQLAAAISIFCKNRFPNFRTLPGPFSYPFREIVIALGFVTLGLNSVPAAEVTIDDHCAYSISPCWDSWDYPQRRDYASMHLKVVTGNVWQHADNYLVLHTLGDGTEPLGQVQAPPFGAAAGTVIYDQQYIHPHPGCIDPNDNPHIFGFPYEVYVFNSTERRGDATGSGLVITATNTGNSPTCTGDPAFSTILTRRPSPS
jgi:hypothetical protein